MSTQTSKTADEVVNLSGEEIEFAVRSESLLTKALRRLRNDRLTMGALFILVMLIVIVMMAPVITNALDIDPLRTQPRDQFIEIGGESTVEPGKFYILGTDDLGRDHLARLLYGGRVSLTIAFSATLVTIVIGLTVGVMAGYFGGVLDDIIMWFITTLNALPGLYLLIAVAALFRPSPESLILVIALTGWTGDTRLMRGQTISMRDLDYVMAARALGASSWRVMFSHIMPNLISILAINMALSIGGIILAEAALSFLNFGVQPPTPTWGNMLTDSQTYFRESGHLVVMPGLLITITVLCLYIIGDGVRDAFDPTTND